LRKVADGISKNAAFLDLTEKRERECYALKTVGIDEAGSRDRGGKQNKSDTDGTSRERLGGAAGKKPGKNWPEDEGCVGVRPERWLGNGNRAMRERCQRSASRHHVQ
jgi:hypothetical protein